MQEINGESSDIRPNVDQLKMLFPHYSMHLFDGSSRITTYIGNRDGEKRVCRFCHQAVPDTLFKHKSHAISEALGYKSVICNEECDECNERFSRTIEPDVVNMNSFLLSLYGVSGKKGVRKQVEPILSSGSIAQIAGMTVKEPLLCNWMICILTKRILKPAFRIYRHHFLILSPQNDFLLHFPQCRPCRTASDCRQ